MTKVTEEAQAKEIDRLHESVFGWRIAFFALYAVFMIDLFLEWAG